MGTTFLHALSDHISRSGVRKQPYALGARGNISKSRQSEQNMSEASVESIGATTRRLRLPRWVLLFVTPLIVEVAAVTLWWLIKDALSDRKAGVSLFISIAIALAVYVVIAGIILGIHAVLVARRKLWASEAVAPNEAERVSAVAVRLRRRAATLRTGAGGSLFLIVLALIGGLGLFYFAKQISINTNDEIIRLLAQKSQRELADIGRAESLIREADYIVDRALQATTPDIRKALASDVAAEATSGIDGAKQAIAKVQSSAATIEKHIIALDRTDQTRELISTIATRVGAVLIIVFLVQILVSLYRYNMRLSAYYDARADALELAAGADGRTSLKQFQAACEIIAPDRIDFGREPKSPVANVTELLKAALAVAEERVNKKTTPVSGA
jgi:hypothetical protein